MIHNTMRVARHLEKLAHWYRVLAILAAGLMVHCGDHDAFLVINLTGIPAGTDKLTTHIEVGTLSTDDTWQGRPAQISMFLPDGTVYWDSRKRDYVGAAIAVFVDAWDLSCVVASAKGRMVAVYKPKQEMTLKLSPQGSCSPAGPMP